METLSASTTSLASTPSIGGVGMSSGFSTGMSSMSGFGAGMPSLGGSVSYGANGFNEFASFSAPSLSMPSVGNFSDPLPAVSEITGGLQNEFAGFTPVSLDLPSLNSFQDPLPVALDLNVRDPKFDLEPSFDPFVNLTPTNEFSFPMDPVTNVMNNVQYSVPNNPEVNLGTPKVNPDLTNELTSSMADVLELVETPALDPKVSLQNEIGQLQGLLEQVNALPKSSFTQVELPLSAPLLTEDPIKLENKLATKLALAESLGIDKQTATADAVAIKEYVANKPNLLKQLLKANKIKIAVSKETPLATPEASTEPEEEVIKLVNGDALHAIVSEQLEADGTDTETKELQIVLDHGGEGGDGGYMILYLHIVIEIVRELIVVDEDELSDTELVTDLEGFEPLNSGKVISSERSEQDEKYIVASKAEAMSIVNKRRGEITAQLLKTCSKVMVKGGSLN